MTKRKPVPFPSKEEVLEFIKDSPKRVGKREIARAFQLDADQKAALKRLLRELEDEGSLQQGRGRRFAQSGTLPPVAMLVVSGIDTDGEVLARPLSWNDKDGPPPVIYMSPGRRGHPALGAGDRVLARLSPARGEKAYEGRVIRRISAAPAQVLGIFDEDGGEGRIRPTDRRAKSDFRVARGDSMGAEPGELVWAEILPGERLGLRKARVTDRLGELGGSKSVSLIAVHSHDIPTRFTDGAVAQAEAAGPSPIEGRRDLRSLPLVTIDGADARDFDDAVWAAADTDKRNVGGWRLIVAIADVAWYVRPGDPLDAGAYERGNSVYFPDRVVPMLPEALSNGWCSLNPAEDRPCLAVEMRIDADGNPLGHEFQRGVMCSAARLTYEQVQAARDGTPDDRTGPLLETVVAPLYGAFAALEKARRKRGVMELDLPERRIVLAKDGTVERVETRLRHDSHRLIEEFMIAANVAAAIELEKRRRPCMYRIHDEPSKDKLESLRQFLDSLGIPFAKGQVVTPARFNRVLEQVRGTPHGRMVSQVVLRSQAQAEYSPHNIGHFGLALPRYCHFTSPIRRYSDLLVHRALIRGLIPSDGGLEEAPRDFTDMGEHLSATERRAAMAERDAVDRFTAAFLADRVGTVFEGYVNGVTRFGLFVTLEETGADGLVPISTLPDDYYVHDEARHLLRGRRSGREFRLGEAVEVMLTEADPVTGGMIMHLMDGGGAANGSSAPGSRRRRARGRRH